MEGLSDHSDVVCEQSEQEVQDQYYRAMAQTEADLGELVEQLGHVVAELLYDFSVVYLVPTEGRRLQMASLHHADALGDEALERLVEEDVWEIGDGVVGDVVATGESFFAPKLGEVEGVEELKGTFLDPDGELGVHSLMVVPMRLGQDVVGQLVCARHATSEPYTDVELALAGSFACHAASRVEQAELNEKLRQTNRKLQEAIELREMFISITSHRLRTPLGTMRLLVEMLRRKAESLDEAMDPDTLESKASGLERQVQRMSETVNRLLDVSRLTDGRVTDLEFDKVDIREVTQEAIEEACEEAEVAIELRSPADPPIWGIWDPDRIAQIASNLLATAIDVSEQGPIIVEVRDSGEYAELVVLASDVSTKHAGGAPTLELLVRRGGETGFEDTGLRLWVVRQLVHAFGGEITVRSRPDQGTVFHVQLPRDVSPYAVSEAGESVEPPESVAESVHRAIEEAKKAGRELSEPKNRRRLVQSGEFDSPSNSASPG